MKSFITSGSDDKGPEWQERGKLRTKNEYTVLHKYLLRMTNIQTMMMIMKPVVKPAVAGSVALSILQSWPPQPLGHRHV